MKVLILSGSKSDEELVKKITQMLDYFGIEHYYEVASAHRNPDKVDELVKNSDAEVFIAVAGLSAALPGVVASKTNKPVIGVPVNAKLNGLDALLSIVQMPSGVPVATVGIDNGKNAAILAVQILSLKYPELEQKLAALRNEWK
ncbi:MAG: 5-(carboxyamino)imidazole ribonucleotide mutase [Candidatus Micrarchaeia archaeon]|jgi:5-(carboxyamino)imidazole ribonucleotide mutase